MCLRFLDSMNFIPVNDLRVCLLLRVKEVGELFPQTLINRTLDCPLPRPCNSSPGLNCQDYFSAGHGLCCLDSSHTSCNQCLIQKNSCVCLQIHTISDWLWYIKPPCKHLNTNASLRYLLDTMCWETGGEEAEHLSLYFRFFLARCA